MCRLRISGSLIFASSSFDFYHVSFTDLGRIFRFTTVVGVRDPMSCSLESLNSKAKAEDSDVSLSGFDLYRPFGFSTFSDEHDDKIRSETILGVENEQLLVPFSGLGREAVVFTKKGTRESGRLRI